MNGNDVKIADMILESFKLQLKSKTPIKMTTLFVLKAKLLRKLRTVNDDMFIEIKTNDNFITREHKTEMRVFVGAYERIINLTPYVEDIT